MKTYYSLIRIIVVWSILVCSGITQSYSQKIYIHEVFYDTPLNEATARGGYHDGEYIVLYNPSSEKINLGGYSLCISKKKHAFYFSASDQILPKSYIMVAYSSKHSKEKFKISFLFPDLYEYENTGKIIYQDKLYFRNNGETIYLLAHGQTIDYITYSYKDNEEKGIKTLKATNGRRGYSQTLSLRSLQREYVSRDNSGNATFHITHWKCDVLKPMGVEIVTQPVDRGEGNDALEEIFIPKKFENSIEVSTPTYNDLQVLQPRENDLLYSYDSSGNMTDRTIYLNTLKSAIASNGNEDNNIVHTDIIDDFNVKIYPNPTQGNLRIELSNFNESLKGTINIISASGKKIIHEKPIDSHIIDIDLYGQPSGIYIMNMYINAKHTSWKIIKN